MMKKRLSILPVLLVLFLLFCGFDSAGQKVYDEADLLHPQEEAYLESLCVQMAQKLELDIVLVTTDDARGKSSRDYADDFYDDGEFGYEGPYGSGVLLLIDMDNRELYLSTAGDAIWKITDSEVERILDAVYGYVSDGDYYNTFAEFLPALQKFTENSSIADNVTGEYDPEDDEYDLIEKEEEPKSFLEKALDPAMSFVRAIISAVAGGVTTLICAFKRKPKVTVSSRNYQSGPVRRNHYTDQFLHTTVTQRRIQSESRSSGGGGGGHSSSHRSSGGHSHGGGGRRF